MPGTKGSGAASRTPNHSPLEGEVMRVARHAGVRPAGVRPFEASDSGNPLAAILVNSIEPFAKFASRWDLLPGRVVIPGSAGVPPAQDLAGSWRLASQGWSVHLPTGAGAAPLQECGRDARAPRGKPMAGQVQIRILQKAQFANVSGQGPRGIRRGLLYLSTCLLYDP